MLIKHQLRSNFFIIFGFHPLFDKEPVFIDILSKLISIYHTHIIIISQPLQIKNKC